MVLFHEAHHDIIQPTDTIHKQLYDYIHQHLQSITIPALQTQFPFLPLSLFTESLCCHEPLPEYIKPPPPQRIITPPPCPQTSFQHPNHIITWNVTSFNTALPNLHKLIIYNDRPLAIIALQETKLTATKSTKYIQNLFPAYKFFFNNTNTPTRCINRYGLPYTPTRGGLLTLVHNTFAYPNNLLKLLTPAHVSPYLQILHFLNPPLTSWLFINFYMSSHMEDLPLIYDIQDIITQQLQQYPNHMVILCGDFNRDIALIG
jgi:hypothetical protein